MAFTYAQTNNRGVGFITLMALYKTRAHPALRRVIVDGYRRGRRAAWLVEQPWEALLGEPLAGVRKRLALGDPPAYERIYAGDYTRAGGEADGWYRRRTRRVSWRCRGS